MNARYANMFDYLELYLRDQMLEHIVHEMNHFANDFITQYPDKAKSTYIGKWTDVTVPELKKIHRFSYSNGNNSQTKLS